MTSRRRARLAVICLAAAVWLVGCAGQGQVPLLYDPLSQISDLKVMEVQPLNLRATRVVAAARAAPQELAARFCSYLP